MKPSASLCSRRLFYVVQSTARPPARAPLSSVLYETRPHARAELVRLSAAVSRRLRYLERYANIEPPQWGHAVMRPTGRWPHRALDPQTVSAALETGAAATSRLAESV